MMFVVRSMTGWLNRTPMGAALVMMNVLSGQKMNGFPHRDQLTRLVIGPTRRGVVV